MAVGGCGVCGDGGTDVIGGGVPDEEKENGFISFRFTKNVSPIII